MQLDVFEKTIYTLSEAAQFFQDEAKRNGPSLANPDQTFTEADVIGLVLSGRLWACVRFLEPAYIALGAFNAMDEREVAINELRAENSKICETHDWPLIEARIKENQEQLVLDVAEGSDLVKRASGFVGGFGGQNETQLIDGVCVLLPVGLGRKKLILMLSGCDRTAVGDVLVIVERALYENRPKSAAVVLVQGEGGQKLLTSWPDLADIVFHIEDLKYSLSPISDKPLKQYSYQGNQKNLSGTISDAISLDKAVEYVLSRVDGPLDDEALLGRTVNDTLEVAIELSIGTPAREVTGVSADDLERNPSQYGIEIKRIPIGLNVKDRWFEPSLNYGGVSNLTGVFRLLRIGAGAEYLRRKYEFADNLDIELQVTGGMYVESNGVVYELAAHKGRIEYLSLCSCDYWDCKNNYFTVSGHGPHNSRVMFSKACLDKYFELRNIEPCFDDVARFPIEVDEGGCMPLPTVDDLKKLKNAQITELTHDYIITRNLRLQEEGILGEKKRPAIIAVELADKWPLKALKSDSIYRILLKRGS